MESKFGDQKYEVAVYDSAISRSATDESGKISSGCLVFVYTAGTKTLATIYGGPQREALANPITRAQFAADGMIKFYGGASSYDVVVNDDKGNTGVYDGVSPQSHSVNMDRSGSAKCLVVPFVFNSNVETDSGLDLPIGVAVYPCTVEVVTEDATETIDVGLLSSESGGDADGLVKAASLATASYVRPYAVTDGSSEDFVASPTVGALIGLGSAGTDAGNDFGQGGGHSYIVGSTARSVSYTCSSGSDTAAGYIYIPFQHLR